MKLPFRRRTVYVADRVAEYETHWRAAAASLDAEFIALTDRLWEVRKGTARTRIANDLVQLDDPVVLGIAGDKELCYRLATELGIPVPSHRIFTRGQLRAAWRWIASDGHPFVIKPRRNTSSGVGVTVGVTRFAETAGAIARAGLRDSSFIAERMFAGESCRLLFLGGEMIHAVRRRGVRVNPDGRATIRELLNASGRAKLADDAVTALTLRAQDIGLDSVPPAGESLLARVLPPAESSTQELRTVYDEDITALVAPELKMEVGQLVRSIGSEWAGVDIITRDPGRGLNDGEGVLLEVNTTPGLHHHCGLNGAPTCDVAAQVLRYILERSR